MSLANEPPTVQLGYNVVGCSGNSEKYTAEKILEDNPSDLASRWSSASSFLDKPEDKQWVLLRLKKVAILSLVLLMPSRIPYLPGVCRNNNIREGEALSRL